MNLGDSCWDRRAPRLHYPGFPSTQPEHVGTHVTERVDGLGRTVEKISRHREGAGNNIAARKTTLADWGLLSESWRQVFPDNQIYHFETRVDAAGQLVYSEDPDGKRSTADYYVDGTFKSSYFDGNQIVKETYGNMFGQTELVRYGDAAQTEVWSGFDPVMHRATSTVVQQQNHTWEEGGQPQTGQATLIATSGISPTAAT